MPHTEVSVSYTEKEVDKMINPNENTLHMLLYNRASELQLYIH